MLKTLSLAAAVFWAVFVAVLCLVSFSDLPSVAVDNADKYVHAFFHFVFTALWYFFFKQQRYGKTIVSRIVRVTALSLLFGIALEIAQSFTDTRSADAMDVLANFTGSLVAAVLIWLLGTIRKSQG